MPPLHQNSARDPDRLGTEASLASVHTGALAVTPNRGPSARLGHHTRIAALLSTAQALFFRPTLTVDDFVSDILPQHKEDT